MLEPLQDKDIQEKIDLNIKDGHTLETLKESLAKELFETSRLKLRVMVQEQNLIEQIHYIERLGNGVSSDNTDVHNKD